ncbi:MAG: glycosyltransferase [Desulfarculaceae bacterium]|nr:glycosyltransferase [Desulfarculaceae bacterium]MCF8072915.1 glycosyltransferase [Desulfarculaceae bacterium]MCF8101083.1 glycosyltransferase [Desulfarculaceae bacterium]MCF8115530.1 glycosyltransferase [Desulfarculaceae bacterium]
MSSPHKVLHAITTTMVGGAEFQLLRLIAASDPEHYQHTVVGLGPEGPLADEMRRAGAEVFSLGLMPQPSALVKGVRQMARIARQVRPQLMQGWMYHANLVSLLAARMAGAGPVIWGVFCSNMEMDKYGLASRTLVKACAITSRQPVAIVSNSYVGVEFHVAQGYPRKTMLVIPNGFDTDSYRPDDGVRAEARAEMGLDEEHLLIGQVARFDPMKDHRSLILAAREVVDAFPAARFVTLGLGMEPDNPALREATEPPLEGHFFLEGRSHDIPRWLKAMDLHVSSSAFGEGLSNAVGEAMACGVPNVVTRVGDSGRLVGDTGLVVPPRDSGALAASIKAVLALDPRERRRLGLAARRRIEQHYSLEVMSRAFDDLYHRFLPPHEDR